MIPLSDDSVEAAARAMCDRAPDAFADFDTADASIQQMWKDEARAAITAYLEAEIKAGRAREAIAAPVGGDYAGYIGAWTTGGEETLRQDETRYCIKGAYLFALLEAYNHLRAAAYEAIREKK